jgi:hypothetical protein
MARKRRFDDLMEAVTFAEAGELDTAQTLAQEVFEEKASLGERILAVGGARGFPRRMVEDALDMAERLRFGIVAVTVAPRLTRLLARLGRRARPAGAQLSAEAFGEAAAQRGVPFVHAMRTGDPERIVGDMSRRFRRIAFLVVEPGLASKAHFSGVDVPIYVLADARKR